MLRTLELRSDGSVHVARGVALVNPPPLGMVRWVDLTDPSEALLALLGERFGFRALTLETCAHVDPHSKVEPREDHLFVLTCGFASRAPDCAMRWHELHAFLGRAYLVTVHLREIPALDCVWRRAESEPELLKSGPDFVYYLLARGFANDDTQAAAHVTDELDRLARRAPSIPERSIVDAMSGLRHQLMELRSVVVPQRDCMAALSLRSDCWLSDQTRFHLRDLHALLAWVTDALDADCEPRLCGSSAHDDVAAQLWTSSRRMTS